jgi:predicted DNA-binding transcriptional regulator AlpA
MTVKTMNESRIKAAISVSAQCKLLKMSRSQFYWHVRKGTFHPPLKLPNGRPYYNASMVEDNVKAKEMGIGVNGQFVIFYERAEPGDSGPVRPAAKPTADYGDLMESLQSLGLTNLTTAIVEKAIAACFPKGTTGQDEQHILRTVFRHLKRAGVG